MMFRCYDTTYKSYRFYGALGITVCDEWLYNPESFETWSMENGYEDTLSIDRIDSSKCYSPDNCRWITRNENSKWKKSTRYIEVDGEINSGRGWSTKLGYGPNYINTYIRKHGIEEAKSLIRNKLSEFDL